MVAAVALAFLASGCTTAAFPGPDAGLSLPEAILGPASGTILVEVAAVAGRAPAPGTLDHLRATLANVTGKPVVVAGPTPLPAQGGGYDEDDIVRIHAAHAFFGEEGRFLSGGRVVLHVLYLDGRMEGDDEGHRTLGRTLLAEGVVAIFRDTYSSAHRISNTTRTSAVAEIDRHVLLHEVGHTLGLVGNGVPQVRDHAAPDHPGHSRYPESVMYFHPPMTPDQRVSGPVSSSFDVDDLADLAAYRRARGR